MVDLSICCLLHNSRNTRAGNLESFFVHLSEIERRLRVQTERVVLVDDRTNDGTLDIARQHSNPDLFKFTDFSYAKNLLLERATGEWVLMTEPDMRYKIEPVAEIFRRRKNFQKYKCIEAFQCVHSPDENFVHNRYYLFMKPLLRFQGLVFETLMAYPHESIVLDVEIGDHYTRKRQDRMQDARKLYEKELDMMRRDDMNGDHEKLYWRAIRYSELGLMDCISSEEMDRLIVSLLERAIQEKKDFGPAYFELAKQHNHMGRMNDAIKAARDGSDLSGYEPCMEFFLYLSPKGEA